MTQLLGIIGYPIRHSLSPVFQQAALDALGIDARYEAWEVKPEDLARRVRELATQGMLGFNVTVPHKESVMPLLAEVDAFARELGAVNTVVNRGGKLVGYNTDAEGFLRGLTQDGGFQPRGVRALVLGAGGSARAVALSLAREGVAWLAIANRTLPRAQALAEEARRHCRDVRAVELSDEALGPLLRRPSAATLIVNCTSMGMLHGPAEGQSPLAEALIPRGALVYDLVYRPAETPLLRSAKRAGARALGGLPMLIYQGAAAFKLWTGRDGPTDVMFAAARRALEG
jgi:shikimate dehydrogenase